MEKRPILTDLGIALLTTLGGIAISISTLGFLNSVWPVLVIGTGISMLMIIGGEKSTPKTAKSLQTRKIVLAVLLFIALSLLLLESR